MKRGLRWAALALLLLAAVLAFRTATLRSRQVQVSAVELPQVHGAEVGERLAGALRFRTISYQDRKQLDRGEFEALHRYLAGSYPRAHALLEREVLDGLSLLYTWRGSNPALAPALLAAHLDVVPVDPAEWTHPPFAGVVEDGVVWGRGAIDDKAAVICLLEAVERLAGEGFRPERTLLLGFGHDEEVGGYEGAVRIVEHLTARGVELAWVLDEGGVIAQNFFPGIDAAVAVIGIAEKGSVVIGMELDAAGGHSSTPPRHTAIGELAAAMTRLEGHPMPARIDGTTALFLDYLGPELPLPARVVLANRWLFDPLLSVVFASQPPLDAMQRTTTAVTIFESGLKENVLPVRAWAVANFRIHPDDSIASVTEHVRRTLDDERIRLQVGVRSQPREPSPVSPVDGEAFALLRRSIAEAFPGVVSVPYLVVGGTDARHYSALGPYVYRFNPFSYGREGLRLAHGTDERISIENLAGGVRFFMRLFRNAAGGPAQPSPSPLP